MTHCTAVNRNTSVRLLSPIKITLQRGGVWMFVVVGFDPFCCPLICLKHVEV